MEVVQIGFIVRGGQRQRLLLSGELVEEEWQRRAERHHLATVKAACGDKSHSDPLCAERDQNNKDTETHTTTTAYKMIVTMLCCTQDAHGRWLSSGARLCLLGAGLVTSNSFPHITSPMRKACLCPR